MVGRSRPRWMDSMLKDIITLKISNWWMVARNREAWRQIMREALKQPDFLTILENKIQRRKFGKWDVEMASQRETSQLYCSRNIVNVIESRKSMWAGHVVRMEEGNKFFNT